MKDKKDKYVILVAILCILLVILSTINAYLSVQSSRESSRKIEHAMQQVAAQRAAQGPIGPVGPVGPIGPKGEAVVGPQGPVGGNGRDGRDAVVDYDQIKSYVDKRIAEKLESLPKTKDGRTPIIYPDPDTGDLLLKYQGDTLWTLLVEKCELNNTCEE